MSGSDYSGSLTRTFKEMIKLMNNLEINRGITFSHDIILFKIWRLYNLQTGYFVINVLSRTFFLAFPLPTVTPLKYTICIRCK